MQAFSFGQTSLFSKWQMAAISWDLNVNLLDQILVNKIDLNQKWKGGV